MGAVVQPFHGEEEAGEAPDREEGQGKEVGHHGTERDEEHVLGHDVEGEAGDEDRGAAGEDVERSMGDLDELVAGEVGEGMHAHHEIDDVDDHEHGVEERPQVLAVDLPAMLEHASDLVERPAGRVDVEHELPGRVVGCAAAFTACHYHDVEEEEDDELYDFDDVPGARDDEAVLIE